MLAMGLQPGRILPAESVTWEPDRQGYFAHFCWVHISNSVALSVLSFSEVVDVVATCCKFATGNASFV